MRATVVLLSALWKSNVRVAYKKITNWTDQYFIYWGQWFQATQPGLCDQVFENMLQLSMFETPEDPVLLPTTNLVFDLSTHQLLSSIFSLFMDEALMKVEIWFQESKETMEPEKI